MIRGSGRTNDVNPSSLVEETSGVESGLVDENREIFLTTIFFLGGPRGEDTFLFRLKWTSESLFSSEPLSIALAASLVNELSSSDASLAASNSWRPTTRTRLQSSTALFRRAAISLSLESSIQNSGTQELKIVITLEKS